MLLDMAKKASCDLPSFLLALFSVTLRASIQCTGGTYSKFSPRLVSLLYVIQGELLQSSIMHASFTAYIGIYLI